MFAQEIPIIGNDANTENVVNVELDPVDVDDGLKELEAELEKFEENLRQEMSSTTEENEMVLKEAEEERERLEQERREARIVKLRRKMKRRREENDDPRHAVPAVNERMSHTKTEKARGVTEKFYERQRKKRRTLANMPFDDPSTGIAQGADAMDLEEIQWNMELTAKVHDESSPAAAEPSANTARGSDVQVGAEGDYDVDSTTSDGSM